MADGINGVHIDYSKMKNIQTNSDGYVLEGTNGKTEVDSGVVEHLKDNQVFLSNGATNEDGMVDADELREFIGHLDIGVGDGVGKNDGIITDDEISSWYTANKAVNGETFVQRFGDTVEGAIGIIKNFLNPFEGKVDGSKTNDINTEIETSSKSGTKTVAYKAQDKGSSSSKTSDDTQYVNNNRTYVQNGGYDSERGQSYSTSYINNQKYDIYKNGDNLTVKYGVGDNTQEVEIDIDDLVADNVSNSYRNKVKEQLKALPGDVLLELKEQNERYGTTLSATASYSSNSSWYDEVDHSFSNYSNYSVSKVDGDTYTMYSDGHNKNTANDGYSSTTNNYKSLVTIKTKYDNGKTYTDEVDLRDLIGNNVSTSVKNNIIEKLKDTPADMVLSWLEDGVTFKTTNAITNARNDFYDDYDDYDDWDDDDDRYGYDNDYSRDYDPTEPMKSYDDFVSYMDSQGLDVERMNKRLERDYPHEKYANYKQYTETINGVEYDITNDGETITIHSIDGRGDGRTIRFDSLISNDLTYAQKNALKNLLASSPAPTIIALYDAVVNDGVNSDPNARYNGTSSRSYSSYSSGSRYNEDIISVGTSPTSLTITKAMGANAYQNNKNLFKSELEDIFKE